MSEPTRVLVLGAGGMLGHKLVHTLAQDPSLEVHGAARRPLPPPFLHPAARHHADVDVTDLRALGGVLASIRPDVVVNAVGAIKQKDLYGALEQTFFLNASLPHLIPLLNPNEQARVIHFSTDCVFRGDRGAYRESEKPDAEDAYGRSKATGEMDYGPHLTIRTSIVGFEISGHLSLLSWLFRQPRGSTLRGFRRAIYSGLPTVTLARTVAQLIHAPELRGLYHVASEPIDKYDLLRRVNDAFGLGHTIVPDDELRIDRSLDDTRFRDATGTARPGWDALVRELQGDFESLPYAPLYGITA